MSTYIMDTDFTIIWSSAFAIITGGVLATTLAGLSFAWAPIRVKPARILRAQE